MNPQRVAFQSEQFAPAFHIPNLHCRVSRSGDGTPPVGAQRDAIDLVSVTFQRAQFLAACDIPTFSLLSLEAETARRGWLR